MTNLKAGQQPPPLRTAARRTSGPGPFQFKFALSEAAVKGSAQIAVEIQHKDTFLADKGAIKHVLAAQGCPIQSD